MTRPALPPLVQQTRILLLTQTWLVLGGLLILMLVIQAMSARGPLDDEASNHLLVLVAAALGAPILLALAAALVRRGLTVGWMFALIAELAVAFLLYAAVAFGIFFGVGALVLVGLAVWVTVNLFRADVRRFLLARTG